MPKRLPRLHDWCEWCGEDLPYKRRVRQRFCNRSCSQRFTRLKYQKLPPVAVLAKMYTLGNMSCAQIADQFGAHRTAVDIALRRAGVELRMYTRGRSGPKRKTA